MKVSLIGTGLMGTAMAEALLRAGYDLTVYNRTQTKANALQEKGATVATRVTEALQASPAIILTLFDAESTREVILSESSRVFLQGKYLLNWAATTPEEIRALDSDITEAGGCLSEGVVIAYPDEVQACEAGAAIGSTDQQFAYWKDIVKVFAPKLHHVGPVGAASSAELALWLSYMMQNITLGFTLAAFEKENLSVEALKSILRENPVVAIPGAEYLLPRMFNRDYESPEFTVSNFVTTVDMIIDFVVGLGLPTEIFQVIRQMYSSALQQGLGDKDTTAVYEVINPSS